MSPFCSCVCPIYTKYTMFSGRCKSKINFLFQLDNLTLRLHQLYQFHLVPVLHLRVRLHHNLCKWIQHILSRIPCDENATLCVPENYNFLLPLFSICLWLAFVVPIYLNIPALALLFLSFVGFVVRKKCIASVKPLLLFVDLSFAGDSSKASKPFLLLAILCPRFTLNPYMVYLLVQMLSATNQIANHMCAY